MSIISNSAAKPEPITQQRLKTALIYDRINTRYGGAEQVLLALHQLFPDAPIYTSVYDSSQASWAKELEVRSSWLQSLPFAQKHHRAYLPLMPLAFEQLDLSEFQLVISITSAEAKGIVTQPQQIHLCYLLTPPRYLYSHQQQYLNSRSLFKLKSILWLAKLGSNYLKWWDQAAINRPDFILPLSQLVRQRVRQYYGLNTLEPIYPPINVNSRDCGSLNSLQLPDRFNLVVSRLVKYKAIETAIQACAQLKQNLVIVGTGPESKSLKKLASKLKTSVWFLDNQPQLIVNSLLAQARLLISPGIDDFGLIPLQANLAGTPAIYNSNSGVDEVIEPGSAGVSIPAARQDLLVAAIKQAQQTHFSLDIMRNQALHLSTEQFLINFKNVVQTIVTQKLNITL